MRGSTHLTPRRSAFLRPGEMPEMLFNEGFYRLRDRWPQNRLEAGGTRNITAG
jgi:hypothetical protein